MLKITFWILAGVLALANDLPELKTVAHVDLRQYLGTWYEIASFPQRFQKGCVASKAIYSLRDDGDIRVINECSNETLDGKLRSNEGKAWVTDKESNSKLRVQFFWPFSGAYWIIDLGKNYEYAVVGHPDRDYLWILSRKTSLRPEVYEGILQRLREQHYDLGPLRKTLQPPS
jgi:apolipoprotein D and lipocalin family protein